MQKQHIVMCNELIDKLRIEKKLSKKEYLFLIKNREECKEYLFKNSSEVRKEVYGNDIYIRGLIEFTNYCKNDCLYCGIRRSNKNAQRYRLTKEDILLCAKQGYELGFRTFVLQGGEDPFYSDEILINIIKEIKLNYPDCAITLSIGERSFDSYKRFKKAGADRYLLRHETADKYHYQKLHPKEMSYENRIKCLENLKKLGYQVGIGPFIPHKDTPFKDEKTGTVEITLFMLGLIRLILPNVLLPATTALGTIDPLGREKGIKAGANVLMPNLSPVNVRKKYMLYDNKICTGDEAAQCIECLKKRIDITGCKIVTSRGDYKGEKSNE